MERQPEIMTSSSSAPALEPAHDRQLHTAVDNALARSRSAFEPILEAEFENATRARRRREIRAFLSIMAAVLVGCLLLDRVAGELQLGIVVRLGVDVPLMLIAVLFLQKSIPVWAEGICLAIPCVATVAGTVVLGETADDFHRSRILMAAGLFMSAVNVASPIRFTHARAITICCIIVFGGLVLSGAGLIAPGSNGDLVGFTTAMGLVSLIVVYRAEAARREAFLLTLRDRMTSLELSRANERLMALSQTDALTNVYNRRFFDTAAPLARANSIHDKTCLALMMIDVDHFKQLNDSSGHAEGDVCLQRIARAIGAHARADDLVARYGGEEFVVILPETSAADAALVAERIRAAIESLHFDYPQGPPVMTVSIGVAALAADDDASILDLVKSADAALYRAKAAGRNRVVGADVSIPA